MNRYLMLCKMIFLSVLCTACSRTTSRPDLKHHVANKTITSDDKTPQEHLPADKTKTPPKLIRSFEHEGKITGIDFSPDGKLLAACGPGQIRVWDFQKGVQKLHIKRKKYSFTDIRFHAGSKLLATGTRGGKLTVWNLKGGVVAEHTPAKDARVDCLAYSRDGGKLAGACSNRIAYVWQEPDTLHKLIGHKAGVQDVCFSPNGKMLVTSGGDHTAKVWDLEKRKNTVTYKHDATVVHAIDCHPDGMHVASAGGPGESFHIWRLADGKNIAKISTGHPGYSFRRLRWGPKGKMLAVCGGIFSKGFFSLWSVDRDGEMVNAKRLSMYRRDGRGANVTALAFHPDGHIVATGNTGDPRGKVRLWETGR